MNSKLIVVGTISAAVGAVVSWAVTADHYDNKLKQANQVADGFERLYNKEADKLSNLLELAETPQYQVDVHVNNPPTSQELLELARSRFGLETSDDQDEIGADEGQEDEHGVRPVSEPDEVEDVIPPGETPEQTRHNLKRIIDEYTAGDANHETLVNTAVKVEYTGRDEAPVVISREEYAWGEEGPYDHYSKTTLTYYPQHRILLDEDEELVEEIPYVIGWRNLSRFGDDSGDADTVFVRNHRMETDFEIVRETDEEPPLHVTYGMSKEEYRVNMAAGLIKPPRFRPED